MGERILAWKRLRGSLQSGLVATDQDDAISGCMKLFCKREANALGSASNENAVVKCAYGFPMISDVWQQRAPDALDCCVKNCNPTWTIKGPVSSRISRRLP